MRKKASLVINPRTGQNLAKITDILAVLTAAGWKTQLAIKEYGGHSMELAQKFSAGPQNLVIAYGGDGTLNQVVNGVMTSNKEKRSAIGVIPGGTANVWAGEVGIPIDPVLAALTLVNSSERKVDVGRMSIEDLQLSQDAEKSSDDKKHKSARGSKTTRHHFLLMAGLGIDAAVMENVSKPLKYRIGPLAVGLSAAKELPSQHAFSIEISSSTEKGDNTTLWQGEAIQVVIGNTRRYADVAEMTPDAYINDGILNICVITGGNPLTTMQQITSLLLRRKPDDLTAEYFQGAHLHLRVPASVPMQLDGSVVDLKDYLSKTEYDTLQESGAAEAARIIYSFDALPKALTLAIPNTYDDALFEHKTDQAHSETASHGSHEKVAVKSTHHDHHQRAEEEESPSQQHTEAEEGRIRGEQETDAEKSATEKQPQSPDEEAHVEKLIQRGRKVTVVGKVPDPSQKETYIIAGGSTKESTGEVKPVAVVVNAETTIFSRKGAHLTLASLNELHEGSLIVVEGKKSKRGVISAARMVV
jgi:YegS/Rv2252/BmrU family lipid kinase